jgi:hypothetical protein
VVKLDSLAVDASREWFIQGMNRLAGHLLRWENFRTTADELRPLVQQQVAMTCVRLLQTTGHLFAVRERTARLNDFWDVLDLYASFFNDDHTLILGRDFWHDAVLPSVATLPGRLGGLMVRQANAFYRRQVTEVGRRIPGQPPYPPKRSNRVEWLTEDHLEKRLLHAAHRRQAEHLAWVQAAQAR